MNDLLFSMVKHYIDTLESTADGLILFFDGLKQGASQRPFPGTMSAKDWLAHLVEVQPMIKTRFENLPEQEIKAYFPNFSKPKEIWLDQEVGFFDR